MATNSAVNFPKPIDVPSGGTGIASATANAPICAGTTSTGAFQGASTGLSSIGTVLTSAGASALPTWSQPPTFVKILTLTASTSATLTFDSTSITSRYSAYFIEFSQIIGDTGGTTLQMQISTDGGATYLNSGYQSGSNRNLYNSTSFFNDSSTTIMSIFPTASAGKTSGVMWINMPPSAACSYVGRGFTQAASSSFLRVYGNNSTTSTITNLQFLMSGGNILSGSITLYGIKQ